MRAKLIKKDEHYFLEVQPYTLSTSQKYTIIANTFAKPKGDILQLSLRNCQAIERGYDLDELADEYCIHKPKNTKELRDVNLVKLGFRDGFQKALEILGDKGFSEDDVNLAFVLGKNKDESRINKLINSKLQQSEWDCIVEMEEVLVDFNDEGQEQYIKQPKLDADGCLILKRI